MVVISTPAHDRRLIYCTFQGMHDGPVHWSPRQAKIFNVDTM
jgi:hypothetical protein